MYQHLGVRGQPISNKPWCGLNQLFIQRTLTGLKINLNSCWFSKFIPKPRCMQSLIVMYDIYQCIFTSILTFSCNWENLYNIPWIEILKFYGSLNMGNVIVANDP